MTSHTKVTITVKWLTLDFTFTCTKHSPPTAKDVFQSILTSLEDESANTEAEDLKSLAHLTRSLARFEPVLTVQQTEFSEGFAGKFASYLSSTSSPHVTLKISLKGEASVSKPFPALPFLK
jgi:hypothetical protein